MNKLDKNDPMSMFHSRKHAKVVKPDQAKRKHEEADLHLAFCKWVKLQYPKLDFIRHEREKQRSFLMQNLFKMYNTENDKMPDFELLHPSGKYHRLYIEFKKPGTKLTTKDNITIKPEYLGQYVRHVKFWDQDSCAYFCSDLYKAQTLLERYLSGHPEPMQDFFY